MTSLSPFISTQDLSDYIGRDATDAGGTIVIDAACNMVRTLAEQSFDEATDTITVDGTGTDAIVLPEQPATNVGTVNLISSSGGTTAVTDYALKDNGVLVRMPGSAIYTSDDYYWPASCWPNGRQNVEVTYTHGYGTADFPTDVRMVALSIASRLFLQGPASFEQLGDSQIRYGTNSTDITAGERAIIHKYRRST